MREVLRSLVISFTYYHLFLGFLILPYLLVGGLLSNPFCLTSGSGILPHIKWLKTKFRTSSAGCAFVPPVASMVSSSSTSSSSSATVDIVRVDLSDQRDYPIYIGTNFDSQENTKFLTSHIHGTKVLIVTNTKLEELGYLDVYQTSLKKQFNSKGKAIELVETLVLPDGEEYKTMDIMERILDKALQLGLDRKATLIALGGGVIGDMVGFAAAIYLRGINFIQVRVMSH
jgi:hypothetical protein